MNSILKKIFIKDSENANDDKVRRRFGVLSGVVGIICNVILFIFKLFIGIIMSSVSVTADAFNNLSDAGSSIVTLVGFKMASRPADDEHPFGHGRIEYISGLIVSMAIILMGLEFIKSSIENIINPDSVSFSKISIIILLISIMVKLFMFFFNRSISILINSSAMKATAMDSLSDVAITFTVTASMLITKYTGVDVDGYVGVLVSLFIVGTGVATAKETIAPLVGTSPDKKFLKRIENKVLSYKGVLGVHDIEIHNYGPAIFVAVLSIEVSDKSDIIEVHNMVDKIEKDLQNDFRGKFIIHVDPVKK